MSQPSHKDSFHAHVVDHNDDVPERKTSQFESPSKPIVEVKESNSGSQESGKDDSELEEPSYSLKLEIDLETIESIIKRSDGISDNIDILINEIELFQNQFEKNIAIQGFTDEYIKDLKNLNNGLSEVEDELNDVKKTVLRSKSLVGQEEVDRCKNIISKSTEEVEKADKNYEESKAQFLNFEESRREVSLFPIAKLYF